MTELGEADAARATDGFAAVISAIQSGADPVVADAARAFLEKEGDLIQLRIRHLEEEHPLRLAQLRGPAREERIKQFGQIIRVCSQAFTALVMTAIAVSVLIAVYGALHSRSVVVAAFKAPAALASRGLTGDVIAAGVQDTLQRLKEATHSAAKAFDIETTWSPDLKIEVPETGLSIDEVDRLLKTLFGHDLHIGGDLVQTADGGLTLTVRGDGVSPRSFTGGAGELDALTIRAAEYVYGRSQPAQFAAYLVNNSRYLDTIDFLPGAFARANTDTLQAELATSWGDALAYLNKPAQSVAKYRMALALKPHYWEAWSDLAVEIALAEGEETAWQESQALLRAANNSLKRGQPEFRLLFYPAQITWDLPLMLSSDLQDAAVTGDTGAINALDAPSIADTYAQVHDPADAARYMAASNPEASATKAEALLIDSYAALDRGDGAAALIPLEAFWTAWQGDATLQATYLDNACLLGLAYGLIGRVAEAEAVFERMRAWSRCSAYHGDVLERAGDLTGAERVWSKALSAAPDLPWIYLRRGLSELNRGDLKPAEADLAAASGKAPHWADPLKAWGDLLTRDGRRTDALAKYTEALKYAPAWVELQQAREAVARQAG